MRISSTWNKGMMTSVREDWRTPRSLFHFLDLEFHFALDVCASPQNFMVPAYYTVEDGSLDRSWGTIEGTAAWCNPPYGRKIGDWIYKAWAESQRGATVVMLLPARTDTRWFHDYCLKGEIRFLQGRLCFDDLRRKRAPFPSMIVIFRRKGEICRHQI